MSVHSMVPAAWVERRINEVQARSGNEPVRSAWFETVGLRVVASRRYGPWVYTLFEGDNALVMATSKHAFARRVAEVLNERKR